MFLCFNPLHTELLAFFLSNSYAASRLVLMYFNLQYQSVCMQFEVSGISSLVCEEGEQISLHQLCHCVSTAHTPVVPQRPVLHSLAAEPQGYLRLGVG